MGDGMACGVVWGGVVVWCGVGIGQVSEGVFCPILARHLFCTTPCGPFLCRPPFPPSASVFSLSIGDDSTGALLDSVPVGGRKARIYRPCVPAAATRCALLAACPACAALRTCAQGNVCGPARPSILRLADLSHRAAGTLSCSNGHTINGIYRAQWVSREALAELRRSAVALWRAFAVNC